MTRFFPIGWRTWPLAVAAVVLTAACINCGGSSEDSNLIGEGEAKEAVEMFMLASYGLLSGQTEPQAFLDLYAPDCREEIDEAGFATALLLVQAFAPDTVPDIEEVDVGNISLEQLDDGALVTLADPENPDAVRIKVDGEFVTLRELDTMLGFESGDEDFSAPLLLVRRDGEIFLGDCSELNE